MEKKGISPVIATVILIAIVVVIGIIIFLWAKAFISESAVKNGRSVEVSCGEVEYETQIVKNVCGSGNQDDALDINNIGNIPIYGMKVLEIDKSTGSVNVIDPLANDPFPTGTLTIGKSGTLCLGEDVVDQDSYRVVPKLLAENDEGVRVPYTCPDKDGITIVYAGN